MQTRLYLFLIALVGLIAIPAASSEHNCCQVAPVHTEGAGEFAIGENGNIVRSYWNGQSATQEISVQGSPIVLGSLVRRSDHTIAGVNEEGKVVITWNRPPNLRYAVIGETSNMDPCSLVATREGIFGVTKSGRLARTYYDPTARTWRFMLIDTWGNKIAAGSLEEIVDGRVVGFTESGGLWNLYHNKDGELTFAITQVDAALPPLQ